MPGAREYRLVLQSWQRRRATRLPRPQFVAVPPVANPRVGAPPRRRDVGPHCSMAHPHAPGHRTAGGCAPDRLAVDAAAGRRWGRRRLGRGAVPAQQAPPSRRPAHDAPGAGSEGTCAGTAPRRVAPRRAQRRRHAECSWTGPARPRSPTCPLPRTAVRGVRQAVRHGHVHDRTRLMAGGMGGGMADGRGPTLAERSAAAASTEVVADPDLAALQDRPRPVLTDGAVGYQNPRSGEPSDGVPVTLTVEQLGGEPVRRGAWAVAVVAWVP